MKVWVCLACYISSWYLILSSWNKAEKQSSLSPLLIKVRSKKYVCLFFRGVCSIQGFALWRHNCCLLQAVWNSIAFDPFCLGWVWSPFPSSSSSQLPPAWRLQAKPNCSKTSSSAQMDFQDLQLCAPDEKLTPVAIGWGYPRKVINCF